jgi:hypothetical protein
VLAQQLVVALLVVHRHAAPRHDAHAVTGFEAQTAQRQPEDHAFDLGLAIFQREVHVPRRPDLAIGQLAFDPHLEELPFEERTDARRQLCNGVDAAGVLGLRNFTDWLLGLTCPPWRRRKPPPTSRRFITAVAALGTCRLGYCGFRLGFRLGFWLFERQVEERAHCRTGVARARMSRSE